MRILYNETTSNDAGEESKAKVVLRSKLVLDSFSLYFGNNRKKELTSAKV